MQAKSQIKVTATDGRIFAETAKVDGSGRVKVRGQLLKLDAAKVREVQLEQRDGNRVTVRPCSIGKDGTVKATPTPNGKGLGSLSAVALSTPARTSEKRTTSKAAGPYDTRTVASLSRNNEREGWELRLRRGDQLTPEQLSALRLTGWRWYGGRLQAFCVSDKHATRESQQLAQEIVNGFNSGATAQAQELAAFAASVANGNGPFSAVQ